VAVVLFSQKKAVDIGGRLALGLGRRAGGD